MTGLWHDAKYGLRQLRRSPGFAGVAILTLALAIGANTAVFSLVYAVLLRPLGFPHADRLVTPLWSYGGATGVQSNVDEPTFRFWRENSRVFSSMAAYSGAGFNLSGAGVPERVSAQYVSSSFFPTLAFQPAIGRNFTPAENRGSGAPVAILSYALWQRQFAGDSAALGKTISLDGVPYAVIGILPASFQPIEQASVYVPLVRAPGPMLAGSNLEVVARLKPGISLSQAQASMQLVAKDYERTHPARKYPPEFGIALMPLSRFLGMGARNYLLLLFGAVGLVLLVACANVAGLLIARAAGRGGEIALRHTLGASRGRLARQLVTESLVLAVLGAAAGVPVAYAGLALLVRLVPSAGTSNPFLAQLSGEIMMHRSGIAINGWSLAFALGAGFLTAILFGLLPAWQSVGRDVHRAIKEAGLRSTAAASRARLRRGLVVAEMALAMILLAGALLLARTFSNLLSVGPGFDASHLLTVQLWMGGSRYKTSPALAGFYHSLTTRVDRLAGVRGAAVVSAGMPLGIGGNMPVTIESVPGIHSVDFRAICDCYLKTLGEPVLAGRAFNDSDTAGAAPVAVVNRAFARRYFGNRNPLGLHVTIGIPQMGAAFMDPPREIVGVVGDVKSQLDSPAVPTVFVPNAQANYATLSIFDAYGPTTLLVRTSGDPLRVAEPVRRAVAALDSSVPVGRIETMDQVRSASVGVERFLLTLMGIFAALALTLTAIGIYGVLSYAVAQRTGEIGVRMALGARPSHILRMVAGEAALLTVVALALGLAGALASTRLLGSLLFGVRASDPASLMLTAAVLAIVAMIACAVPAWRAMRVDPIAALHYE